MTETTPSQLFAECTRDKTVLNVRVVVPTISEREGKVISGMIENEFAEAPGVIRFVVLDLRDVSFINSAGLGACVTIHKTSTVNKGTTVLYGMRKDIESVFKMCKLDKLFKLASDEKKLGKILP